MNLKALFEKQKELDDHIESEHPRQDGEDRLEKKILALQVELGELCQEWRGFKFWKVNQQPVTYRPCSKCGGLGWRYIEGNAILGKEQCPECKGEIVNPLLEEYVDCLHFILSIGLELELDDPDIAIIEDHIEIEPYYRNNIFEHFRSIFHFASRATSQYNKLFNAFVGLGEWLGFSWEEVEEAYDRKNAINHTRQEQSY